MPGATHSPTFVDTSQFLIVMYSSMGLDRLQGIYNIWFKFSHKESVYYFGSITSEVASCPIPHFVGAISYLLDVQFDYTISPPDPDRPRLYI